MKMVVLAALLAANWNVAEARQALVGRPFLVADTTQADRPQYRLTFSARAARSLRPGLVFDGLAHDTLTDQDVRVRFTFTRPGRIKNFRGPPADTSQPSFPIRAAFYYAWYPEAWARRSMFPYSRFRPSLDFYSTDDAAVVRSHLDAMRYAQLDAGIYSWWGAVGYPYADTRFWRYLAAARTTPFRWAIYYEREGYEDPSVETIRSELEYVHNLYATRPAYMKVDGRFVVFVYGAAGDACETARRWHAANTVGAYIVLKAFDGYTSCDAQPQAWHQYSASVAAHDLSPDAFMVSPGFDEPSEPAVRLARDLTRWREAVAAMIASGARWQLVLTFNEWPEGTSVESAREWATPSGFGAYLDVLHELLR